MRAEVRVADRRRARVAPLVVLVLSAACGIDSPGREGPGRTFANPPGEPRPARALSIDVAAPDAPCAFTSGFSQPEPWRWSSASSSRLDFEFTPDAVPYALVIEGHAADGPSKQIVRVSLNGRSVGELAPPLQEGKASLDLPTGALKRGHNVLELSYAWTRRASQADARDIAVSYRRIAITPPPSELTLDVGSAEARNVLASGWSHEERDAVRAFAWSDGPRSALALRVLPRPARYELRLRGLAIAPSLAIDVSVNGHAAGRVRPGEGWGEVRLPIDAAMLLGGENQIVLTYSETRRPSATDRASTDTRDLGYALSGVAITPARGPS